MGRPCHPFLGIDPDLAFRLLRQRAEPQFEPRLAGIQCGCPFVLEDGYAGVDRGVIEHALIRAKRRGVDVRLIVDRGQFEQDRNDSVRVAGLASAGIPLLVDTVAGLMHNKVMVIDSQTVLTGSFNYTWGAEHRNAENLLVLHDPALAAEYLRNWNQRAAQSTPLIEAGVASPLRPVVGNRRTMIYQSPGCRFYNKIAFRNRIEFPDAQAAEAAGYRPARNCR